MAGNIDPGQSEKVHINRASKEELMQVKGISETLAAKIVEYRDEHGGFKGPEDLRNVEGFSDTRASELEETVQFD